MAGMFQRMAMASGAGPTHMGVAALQGLGLTEPEHVAKAARGAGQVREHAAAARTAAEADDCAAARDAVLSAGQSFGTMQAHAMSIGTAGRARIDEAMTQAEDAYVQAEDAVRRLCGGRAPAQERQAMAPPPGGRPPIWTPGMPPGFGPPPPRFDPAPPQEGGAGPMAGHIGGHRRQFLTAMAEADDATTRGLCAQAGEWLRSASGPLGVIRLAAREAGVLQPQVRSRMGMPSDEEATALQGRMEQAETRFFERCLTSPRQGRPSEGGRPPGLLEF